MKKLLLSILLISNFIMFGQCPTINTSSSTSVQFAVGNGECNSYPSTVEITNNTTGITYTMTRSCQGNSPKLTYSNGSADIGNDFSVSFDGGATTCTYVDNVLPIDDFQFTKDKVLVYPNPISKSESLKVQSSIEEILSVKIFDMTGKVVNVGHSIKNNSTEMAISNLNNGVYFIKIETEENTVTKKLVITN